MPGVISTKAVIMSKAKRIVSIVIIIVAVLVLAAAVAVRLILTRERLMTLVVPRIEKKLDASVGIDDIGVRFPFGFGIDAKGLSFSKVLPDSSTVTFTSDKIVFRASLFSLIRRKPEIKKVTVDNGAVRLTGHPKGIDVTLEGLSAGFSMNPDGEAFRIGIKTGIRSIGLLKPAADGAINLEDIGIEGVMRTDADFKSISTDGLKCNWEDLVTLRVSGEARKIKDNKYVSINVESRENRLKPVVERVLSLDLGSMGLPLKGKDPKQLMPFEIEGGTFGFDAKVEGILGDPNEMGLSGTIIMDGVSLVHDAVKRPVTVDGTIGLSDHRVDTDGLSITFGRSRATVGFGVSVANRKKIETVSFRGDLDLDVADLVSALDVKDVEVSGKARIELSGQGRPDVLTGLFPSPAREVTPGLIGWAWRNVSLTGRVEVARLAAVVKDNPFRISSFDASAGVSRGDMTDVSGTLLLNGSPFKFTAAMKRLMPVFAEMALRARESGTPADPGRLLDAIENVPDFTGGLSGRSIDVRPLEARAAGRKASGGAARDGEKGEDGADQGQSASPASAALLVFLKNTAFSARLDSFIAGKGIITDIQAIGRIADGRIHIEPVTLKYAGGRGRVSADIDLRHPGKVTTRADVNFTGIEAGEALGAMQALGRSVRGAFDCTADAELETGPGIDPLDNLRAAGSARSSNGTVNFSPFIAPLSSTTGLDLSRYERFDYRKWTGSFLIRDGRFITDDWKIGSPGGDWSIAGSFGFDGNLDYRVNLVIPPSVQREMKDLAKCRDLVDLFRDREGNIALDFRLGGNARSPKVFLDTDKAQKRAGEKLIDSIKKKAKDLFK